jgi:hypothetical protein
VTARRPELDLIAAANLNPAIPQTLEIVDILTSP